MTKLKLGPIQDDKPVKVKRELSATLHRERSAYIDILAERLGRGKPNRPKLVEFGMYKSSYPINKLIFCAQNCRKFYYISPQYY